MDILQLKNQLEKHGYIAALWHIDDVKGLARVYDKAVAAIAEATGAPI